MYYFYIMRQLDLFGSFFETPEEGKPEEKPVVSKKEKDSSNVSEAASPSYSKNSLRSERVVEDVSGTTNKIEEDAAPSATATTLPSSTSSPLFLSLFDAPPPPINEVEPVVQESQLTETPEIIDQSEVDEAQAVAITETAFLPEETRVETEVLIIEEQVDEVPSFESDPVLEVKNISEKPKRLNQKQPELQRNGSVIFDDGKITVKLKSTNPFPAPVVKVKKEKVKRPLQKRGRKSFKEIDAEVDLIEIPEDEILFQKQYYAISEVARWFRVNTSLLRFWENEFDVLKPRKNRKGDRLFRPEDVKNLQLIYQLLRQRKYTIEGAKEYIKTNKKKADIQLHLTNTLQKFKSFLLDMKANLQP